MNLICLGISHQTAPVDVRERLAIGETDLPKALEQLSSEEHISEVVVLSTCNRVETYAVASHTNSGLETLEQYLRTHCQIDAGTEVPFFRNSGTDTAMHLFRVASGLESMVLGETEIFGQVKKAYSHAQTAGTTAKILNKLFQQSFQVGKHIRNNTQIQRGSTSVGSVAVDLAERVFGNLRSSHVMLIGAGEMSRTVAQSLMSRGALSVVVSNRSYDKAEELANDIGGKAIRFDDWERASVSSDIIITSTSAPHTLIDKPSVAQVMQKRRGRPLIIVDIAVPRDVEPDVTEVPDVYLYPIDALSQIANQARLRREKAIQVCEKILKTYVADKGIPALDVPPDSYSKPSNQENPSHA